MFVTTTNMCIKRIYKLDDRFCLVFITNWVQIALDVCSHIHVYMRTIANTCSLANEQVEK